PNTDVALVVSAPASTTLNVVENVDPSSAIEFAPVLWEVRVRLPADTDTPLLIVTVVPEAAVPVMLTFPLPLLNDIFNVTVEPVRFKLLKESMKLDEPEPKTEPELVVREPASVTLKVLESVPPRLVIEFAPVL